MTFHPATNCAEIVIAGDKGGQQIVTTFYGQKVGGYTSDDIQDLADAVDGWMGLDGLSLFPDQYLYIETRVRGMSDALDFFASANANSGAGQNTGASKPNNVAFAVSRRSIFTGRGARGRIFLLPTEDWLSDENHVDAAQAEAIVTVLNGFKTVLDGVGFEEVILHRKVGSSWLSEATKHPVITYAVADLSLDSQRRRLPGRGS